MNKLYQYADMEEFKGQTNKKGQDKYNRKYLSTLMAYLLRLPESEEVCFSSEKELILRLAPQLIEMLFDVCKEVLQGMTAGQIKPTKLHSHGLLFMAEQAQNVAQGLWYKDSPFMQLPGMGYD